ncbi:hypothetical protein TWF481_002575 [Arthrobotrys musiformis]|uniref:Uncharacterized protein n=1 Tax=Arthrobotrys musiformis TaxID=47236 RepID=A0AAV9VQL1_9PEZI
MNNNTIEASASLQRAIEASSTPTGLEIYRSKSTRVETPEDYLSATKYRITPPPTPKDTSRGSSQSNILPEDGSEEQSLRDLPFVFTNYQSSESGSSTIRATPRIPRSRLSLSPLQSPSTGEKITGLQPSRNTTTSPADSVPPLQGSNTVRHTIDLSYEIDDEFPYARVSALRVEPTSGLPECSMPAFHFQQSTIQSLAQHEDLNLRQNIAQVCQQFHMERTKKEWAQSKVTVLKIHCSTLEKDKVKFLETIAESHKVQSQLLAGATYMKQELADICETAGRQDQQIQQYQKSLEESHKKKIETERENQNRVNILGDRLMTVEQKLLASEQALKMADDAYMQKLKAAYDLQAKILADIKTEKKDMQSRLKGQRVIHFLVHILLLVLLIFVLLGGVLEIPGLRKGLQHLQDAFEQKDYFEKMLSPKRTPSPTIRYLN